ncbi:integrase core domain-containing protein [Antribacter gilvus]|uniref:integrase core domain-containing protein n=1 Tax=Antribacter gilvus TaxID=2304675 RepID=UPI000F7979F6
MVNSVPPDVRWAIVQFPLDPPRGAVSRFCAEHGISRRVFYKIRAAARRDGPVPATEPGSRRPRSSPSRTDQDLLDIALKTRTWLREQGLDHGPVSVVDRMRRDGLNPPSRATLARWFARAGHVRPEPRKRPRSANRRFVYPCPNACWQLDATDWTLADGRRCVIFQLIDDHSRLAVASRAAWGETGNDAIAVFDTAVRRHGVPQRLLSDNGTALNPTRRGVTGRLVEHVRALGVTPITGKPYKPTTQGKNERFHQTLHKWLNARPPARTLPELQTLLDTHDAYYNTQRPHQALPGHITPQEAWDATAPADPPTPPDGPPLPPPPTRAPADGTTTTTISPTGRITWRSCELYLGRPHADTPVTMTWDQTTITVTGPDGTILARYPRPAPRTRYLGTKNRLPTP